MGWDAPESDSGKPHEATPPKDLSDALPANGGAPTSAEERDNDNLAVEQDGGLKEGTVIGSYSILSLLGEGGMGRVYLAEHVTLRRKVAMKVLRAEHTQNAKVLRRFFTEARAVNQINHEHIVQITDFIENEDGHSCIIMELLKGQSLGQLVKKGPLPLDRALGIAVQICSALSAVHAEGFVHRDLKPDNVFLTERWGQRDFVKLLDFGVVKLAEPPEGMEIEHTSPSTIVGTPAYMSPEQAKGRGVDHRSDIYSLGIILYRMITGKKPLDAKSYGEYVVKHLTVKPVRPNKRKDLPYRVPHRLEALIMQCLEKEKDKRPQAVDDVLEIITVVAEEVRLSLEQHIPTSYTEHPLASWRRRLALILGGILLFFGAAVLTVFLTMEPSPTDRQGRASSADVRPPATPDAAVRWVKILLQTAPSGATVFRMGSDTPVGTTPLSLTLERSPRADVFEFRLDGHEPARRRIQLQADIQLRVDLVERKEPTSTVPRSPKPEPRASKPRRRSSRSKRHHKAAPKAPVHLKRPDPTSTIDPFRKRTLNR